MSTTRIEAFSDGVFAIAITLLVIEIHAPEETDHLLGRLLELWPSYLAYVISFLLIGLIWANHHVMFERIERFDRVLMFENTLLLMNVAFIPFTAAVLASALRSSEGEQIAVALYGGSLAIGGVFFNGIWRHAHRAGLLADSVSDVEAVQIGRRFLIGPMLYAAGAIVGYFAPIVGIAIFAFLILFYWLPPTLASRRRTAA